MIAMLLAPPDAGGWGLSFDDVSRMTLYQVKSINRWIASQDKSGTGLTVDEAIELASKQDPEEMKRQREQMLALRLKFTGKAELD